MKIVKAEAKEIRFGDLNTGDVFEWNDGYYMIIFSTDYQSNAVGLDDGNCLHFEYDDMVTPVDCELAIK